ncbi:PLASMODESMATA CALLOSE-BINDING PROTEIN 5-like isoform X1 [Syzygium oleosum]|uniref:PLASMODESMATA CALLOSE-BINDING PROTEIN 5-like isoform X1 n=1 Tax=Syzygium oleosum TaxID=219896 RepID=UPI0011D281C7|nr:PLASMODESMATA CALLOSE-BINDING PROTEIN 5-like isoform X1 [Syzygium oleosum]
MGGKRVRYAIILLCHLFLLPASGSGSLVTRKEAVGYANEVAQVKKYQPSSPSGQKDITNPVTTVPTMIPAPFASADPVVNPTSNPELAPPTVMTPTPFTATVTSPPSLSSSWCIASQSVSQTALQVALDYACGYGGADCSAIQTGGSCYYPNTVHDHASYAFNKYYQKNPVPTSCSFGGTAVVTSTDPSSSTCQYQSTSTASSILNTTNSSGATVFGAEPSGPSTSSASQLSHIASLVMTLSWLSFASGIH